MGSNCGKARHPRRSVTAARGSWGKAGAGSVWGYEALAPGAGSRSDMEKAASFGLTGESRAGRFGTTLAAVRTGSTQDLLAVGAPLETNGDAEMGGSLSLYDLAQKP